jgi:hypothetical protein
VDLTRPVAASASLTGVPSLAEASAYPALVASSQATPAWRLTGEIARLDRAVRF